MASNISPFPILTNGLLEKIGFSASTYKLFYSIDEQEYPLVVDDADNSGITHKLKDQRGIWSPDTNNLCITSTYSFNTCQCLFGKDGIASKNSILGVAVVWTSADSKQRGVKKVGEFTYNSTKINYRMNLEFDPGQLRGVVELKTIIYLKEAREASLDEKFLANENGCLLGEIYNFSIVLDGRGSFFPVYNISDSNKPLWYVKCDWDDPTVNKFTESVSIYINMAHKNYRFLDKTKSSYDEQLIREIMLSALLVIIMKLKEEESDWTATTNGVGLAVGSVSEAIYYFISTLEWDVSSIEKTSMSIKNFFDQRI